MRKLAGLATIIGQVSVLAVVAGCTVPEKPCVEVPAPYVLKEGTYNKYGDENIVARECVPPAPPKTTTSTGGGVLPDPDDPPPPPPPPPPPEDPGIFRRPTGHLQDTGPLDGTYEPDVPPGELTEVGGRPRRT